MTKDINRELWMKFIMFSAASGVPALINSALYALLLPHKSGQGG